MPDEQDLAESGHAPETANTALLIPCVRTKMLPANYDQESNISAITGC